MKKYSDEEVVAYLNRAAKRANRAAGYGGPSKWVYGGGEVEAFTKSEARSKIKKKLGLKRLPIGFEMEEVRGV